MTLVHVPLTAIRPSQHNPRNFFDQDELTDLAISIERYGVLNPIRVIPHPQKKGKYLIVAGERRWRASILAHRSTIPALIATQPIDMEERNQREIQLIENLHRTSLSPTEEAKAFNEYLVKYGSTVKELALYFRKTEHYIRDRLSLLTLAESIQHAVARGTLPLGSALALRPLANQDVQQHYAEIIIREHLTIEQSRGLIQHYMREQRQAKVKAWREQRLATIVAEVTAQTKKEVITNSHFNPQQHHRIYDLVFPACQSCQRKAHFVTPSFHVEDLCIVPTCWEQQQQQQHSRTTQYHTWSEQQVQRRHAIERVLEGDTVEHEHLQYLLWVLLQLKGSSLNNWRESVGLMPIVGAISTSVQEWEVISSWSYERVLTALFGIGIAHVANIDNITLPYGLRKSLHSRFGVPSKLLGLPEISNTPM